ncbi:hypothetical protein [Novosphingobium sp. Chol11]|uniref:hypothetical protein n=1 Tax=Novosphingobium sp. Chol11 TaxID=1385763 RepID=UPI000BE2E37C|nr:hypothetical protein [Novosphingobium sp. Chol11]
MKRISYNCAIFVCALVALTSNAQAQTDAITERNNCLKTFDAKARAKKVSVDSYKLAVEGACAYEQKNARALYQLSLELSPNQDYLVERFDQNYADLKAKMVTAYVMGD